MQLPTTLKNEPEAIEKLFTFYTFLKKYFAIHMAPVYTDVKIIVKLILVPASKKYIYSY